MANEKGGTTTNGTKAVAKIGEEKQFSSTFVTCLLAAIGKGSKTPVSIDYKYMAALTNGSLNLTYSAIEHQMRDIKKKAVEMNQNAQAGEDAGTPLKSPKAGKTRAKKRAAASPAPDTFGKKIKLAKDVKKEALSDDDAE